MPASPLIACVVRRRDMKLLLVKTTSFGDVLHAFPALNDAWRSIDGLVCDWLVEAPYAAMPAWHPAVREVIPVSMRGWRRAPWIHHLPAVRRFIRQLRGEHYDIIIDAQGLMKSALLARLARGRRVGYDRRSISEPVAARLYDGTVAVGGSMHAVDRIRALFAGALGYPLPEGLDYGLQLPPLTGRNDRPRDTGSCLVFIPGTTWPSKRWPIPYWRTLTGLATGAGLEVAVVSGSAVEQRAAERIAEGIEGASVQPALPLDDLARFLAGARAVVSVDSGPGHLAAAVGTPGVSIYGATDAALTGTRGTSQVHLSADFECSPCLQRRCQFTDRGQVHPDCYATVPPRHVWSTLHELIRQH